MVSKRAKKSFILAGLTLSAFVLGRAWQALRRPTLHEPAPTSQPSLPARASSIRPLNSESVDNKAPQLEEWYQAALLERRNQVQRPHGEWQGMKVDAKQSWPCYLGTCSMARACIEDRCLPCQRDDQCEDAESCVFDHCVLKENVECRAKKDCEHLKKDEEVWCVLSGYSTGDMRGNADMRAYCLVPSGGTPDPADPAVADLSEAEFSIVQPKQQAGLSKPLGNEDKHHIVDESEPEFDQALSSLRAILYPTK